MCTSCNCDFVKSAMSARLRCSTAVGNDSCISSTDFCEVWSLLKGSHLVFSVFGKLEQCIPSFSSCLCLIHTVQALVPTAVKMWILPFKIYGCVYPDLILLLAWTTWAVYWAGHSGIPHSNFLSSSGCVSSWSLHTWYKLQLSGHCETTRDMGKFYKIQMWHGVNFTPPAFLMLTLST